MENRELFGTVRSLFGPVRVVLRLNHFSTLAELQQPIVRLCPKDR